MTELGKSAARGAAATAVASVIKLFIHVLGIAVLARLLLPEVFGLMAIALVLVSIGVVIRDAGLSTAAIQAVRLTNAQRTNLFWANVTISTLTALSVCAISGPFASHFGFEELSSIIVLMSLSILFGGISAQYRANASRDLAFLRLGFVDVTSQILSFATAVVLAVHDFGVWALVGQQLMYSASNMVLTAASSNWHPTLPKKEAPMRDLFRFGFTLLAVQVVNGISRQFETIVLAGVATSSAIGVYNRAGQLVNYPLTQIQAPATSVAVPVLSKMITEPIKFERFLIRGQGILMHLVLSGLVIGFVFTEPLVFAVLGAGWNDATDICRLLIIAAAFQCANYASYWVFISKSMMRELLRHTLISRGWMLFLILIGSKWGPVGVASAMAAAMASNWILAIMRIGKYEYVASALFKNSVSILALYALTALTGLFSFSVYQLSIIQALGVVAGTYIVLAILIPGMRASLIESASTIVLLRRRQVDL